MIYYRPIGLMEGAKFLKTLGRFLLCTIISFFLFFIDPGSNTLAATEDLDSAGVLITGFEFFRPHKPPESEDVAAMKDRRRQIESMIRTEKDRHETAPERTKKNILAHIEFLENSLKELDGEIIEEGDTIIPSHELQSMTTEYKDRELTLEEMNEVADLVTTAYQEKGYILARAYVPEQEIEDGVLKIAIVEGDVADITVTGQKYYSERVIKRNFMEQLKHGVIREELLEKGLLLTKELPDAETRIVLEPGKQPGSANLALQTDDRFAFDMDVDFNNFGSELIGKERYGTHIEITDPWWGSTLNLRGVTGNDPKDSSLMSGDLSIPVSNYGTRLNLTYMDGAYIVGQELADLGLTGESKVYGAGISHPLLRTRNNNLTMSLGWDRKFTKSYMMNEIQNIDDVNTYYATLDFDSLDRFLGKNLASIGYYRGNINPELIAPPTRSIADKNFHRYIVNLARIQKIYGNINVMLRASAQKSNDNLLPIEQMAIGGYGTVRGHNTSMFLGDSGFTFSTELLSAPPFIADKIVLGQRVAQMAQLAIFFDSGRVFYTDPMPGEADERLSGWGGGIRLYYKDLFTFKFDVAFPTKEKAAYENGTFFYFMGSINFTSEDFRLTLKKIGDAWQKSSEETGS